MSKVCFKCGEEKDISYFYAHSMMADGHLNKCKECCKIDIKQNREKKKEYYIRYDKERALTPERKALKKRVSKAYKENFPRKKKAHAMISNSIRDGKLFRKPCEECGEARSHAHHDDYAKPLEVRWLCSKHHRDWHKANGEALNAK
jgi:ribosomal protein S27AE